MKSKLFFIACIFYVVSATAQTTFQKTYGTPLDEQTQQFIQTTDHGYCFLGSRAGFLFLAKTDSSGVLSWSKQYSIPCLPATQVQHTASFVQTADKGYAICNGYDSSNTGQKGYLLKTDSAGSIAWFKTYDSTFCFYHVMPTLDHGYILTGKKSDNGGIVLQKTDSAGTLLWATAAVSGHDESGYDVVQATLDSGYYVLGGSVHLNGAILSKFSKTGAMLWAKSVWPDYNGSNMPDAFHLIMETPAKLLLSGNFAGSLCMLETDTAGTLNWAKIFSWKAPKSSFYRCQDKGYLISSSDTSSAYSQGLSAIVLVKTDSLFNFQWKERIGGILNNFSNTVLQDKDGDATVGGSTKNFSSGQSDFYLIKTDALGNHTCNDSSTTYSFVQCLGTVQAFGGTSATLHSIASPQVATAVATPLTTNNACGCVAPTAGFTVHPNYYFMDSSTWASKRKWTFGDGTSDSIHVNPFHGYHQAGKYQVCLTVSNACGSNTFCDSIVATAYPYSIFEYALQELSFVLFPNPTTGQLSVQIATAQTQGPYVLEIDNLLGELVSKTETTSQQPVIDLSSQAAGIYFLKVRTSNGLSGTKKIIKQ